MLSVQFRTLYKATNSKHEWYRGSSPSDDHQQGSDGSGKVRGQLIFLKVREKSGNFFRQFLLFNEITKRQEGFKDVREKWIELNHHFEKHEFHSHEYVEGMYR